jgi:hypothetical protein
MYGFQLGGGGIASTLTSFPVFMLAMLKQLGVAVAFCCPPGEELVLNLGRILVCRERRFLAASQSLPSPCEFILNT